MTNWPKTHRVRRAGETGPASSCPWSNSRVWGGFSNRAPVNVHQPSDHRKRKEKRRNQ